MKKGNKGLLIGIGILVLVAIVGIALFFAFANQKTEIYVTSFDKQVTFSIGKYSVDILCVGKITEQLGDEPLLFHRRFLQFPRFVAFFNALARSNIFYEMLTVLRRTCLDISPLQNKTCHQLFWKR